MGANPTGLDREPRRDLYFFIHNVYANFFKDSLDYFSLHLNPRFKHRVVGTYDKAVEYIQKTCQYERESDRPQLPALILNPTGEFELADANAGGRQFWRFPNLAPGMIKRIFDPVYQDENVQVTVGFIRMQGDIELLLLLNSFYEYCDMRMLFLQIFGGFERWIYPKFFTTFVILPEELINYEYTNPETGLKYKLDWASAGAYDKLVRTTARNELVIPCNIKPIYKLIGFNDASTRYGGADQLADWRLGVSIKYEIEIPSYLVLTADYLVDNVEFNLSAGSAYSAYSDYSVPEYKIIREVTKDWGYDSTSSIDITQPGESPFQSPPTTVEDTVMDGTTLVPIIVPACIEDTAATELEYIFNTRYFHTITQAEVDSTANVPITILERIEDLNGFVVNSKYGEMTYKEHYTVEDGPPEMSSGNIKSSILTIIIKNVALEVGQIIELYIYKRTN